MENDGLQKDHYDNSVDLTDSKSSENFQKFIYELFEKNGVLSDLRAYLRGHIVNVLKSVHTGDTPTCQKHFTERLELKHQALNILIAEYLLRLNFTYSLSVFISEIPLANMVFDFSNYLLQCKTNDSYKELRFKEGDVWCILNYLGIKCDSESAYNIVYMYRDEPKYPLILCILKCLPLCRRQPGTFEVIGSEACMSGSSRMSMDSSMKSTNKDGEPLRCKHYAFCDSCKQRLTRIQRKYKKKKEQIYQNTRHSSDQIKVEGLLKNVDVMERGIIDELFDQLKSVYDTEVEMVREQEERKIKRSLANHALLLQKRYDEMEESFKAREAELECNVQQKKKFLWGLARALREQHSNMSVAMNAVQVESERLTSKENCLQNQIKEAEQMLRKHGDDIRSQISNEMIVLESRLNSMRNERDVIERERSELEKLKQLCDTNAKSVHSIIDRQEMKAHYELLQDELLELKKHLTAKLSPTCLVERGVMTDRRADSSVAMNNEQELDKCVRSEDAVRTPNQLVNDLKKQKNVNFNQEERKIKRSLANHALLLQKRYDETNLGEIVTERSRSTIFHDTAAEHDRHLETLLREENERLKAFSDQQREHIDELSREHVRLRSELVALRIQSPRPRTAPTVMPSAPGVNPSGSRSTTGWRKGAGEELSVFADPHPRILLPGDVVPFVGPLSDRQSDSRRYLINQWRSLRRRVSPVSNKRTAAVCPHASTSRQDNPEESSGKHHPVATEPEISGNTSFRNPPADIQESEKRRPEPFVEVNKRREKSPKSVLQEAKSKLRNKSSIKHQPNTISREKSPNSMLREAKLRLRKLEIEAEAVEKSYLDFRRRRSELRREEDILLPKDNVPTAKETGHNLYGQHSTLENNDEGAKPNNNINDVMVTKECLRDDFVKYFKAYQGKNIMKQHFINKTTAFTIKPIPDTYMITQEREIAVQNVDYLDTPLTEFRKLYHNKKSRHTKVNLLKSPSNSYETKQYEDKLQISSENLTAIVDKFVEETETNKLTINEPTKDTIKELDTSKKDINEACQLSNDDIPCRDQINIENTEAIDNNDIENLNLLKVEVDNVPESARVKIDSQDDLMIVVETSIADDLTASRNIDNYVPISVVITPRTDTSQQSARNADVIKSSSPISIKNPSPKNLVRSNDTPERAAHLTRNDVLDAIFDMEAVKETSSADIGLYNSKETLDLIETDCESRDYTDDFLADVDNYNSISEIRNSPISQAKTSDDNFWD